eukprot:Platyproteum_vivax@DN2835_c0_g1_i2.p1
MATIYDERSQLREAIKSFVAPTPSGSGIINFFSKPLCPQSQETKAPLNIYLFGPQGSGKSSFIRTCYRALNGFKETPDDIKELEKTLDEDHTGDGTLNYSVYGLSNNISIHDTRGQRMFGVEEQGQLELILEGRAKPNCHIQQRKRYWFKLGDYFKSNEQMSRCFSSSVAQPNTTLSNEPHFVFFVLDPTQQQLLLEDEDFQKIYSQMALQLKQRNMPCAILCTHADVVHPQARLQIMQSLPLKLGLQVPDSLGSLPLKPRVGQTSTNATNDTNYEEEATSRLSDATSTSSRFTFTPGNLPGGSFQMRNSTRSADFMQVRFVTNYTQSSICERKNHPIGKKRSSIASGKSRISELSCSTGTQGFAAGNYNIKQEAMSEAGSDVAIDVHTLHILLDALSQGSHALECRVQAKTDKGLSLPPKKCQVDRCVIS